MALNSLFCADVPLSNYSLTHCSRRLTRCYCLQRYAVTHMHCLHTSPNSTCCVTLTHVTTHGQ